MNPVEAVNWLRTPVAIRQRCGEIFNLAKEGKLEHFRYYPEKLSRVVDLVLEITKTNHANLAEIPYHSRWRHFNAGGTDRLSAFEQRFPTLDAYERGRAKFDLVVTSVLLDAGAGMKWSFLEPGTIQPLRRSEGLAVASWHMFMQGAFSTDKTNPWRADAAALQNLSEQALNKAFQVSAANPLVGVPGRAKLLQTLGKALQSHSEIFGETNRARVGNMFDYLLNQVVDQKLPAAAILAAVLCGFGGIWPGRVTIAGENLGDVWKHSAIKTPDQTSGLIPFHKLSQWLTYSLIEPLEQMGIQVVDVDALTGLPEYRNGGLFIDTGVLQPVVDGALEKTYEAGDELIVEWRALTVALLDEVAALIRSRLNLTSVQLPLAKILEGGTWSAGREIATKMRADGGSPIRINSDGTVF